MTQSVVIDRMESTMASKNEQPRARSVDAEPHSDISVRQFRPEDLPTVARIFAESSMCLDDDESQRHRWHEIVKFVLANDMAAVEETYMLPGGNFWVATADEGEREAVVGMAALLRTSPTEGEIKRVSVDVQFHRRGVGRRLMAHLERWAIEHGLERLVLGTGAKNTQSTGFYRSLGFELQPRSPMPTLFRDPPYFELATFVKRIG
jgi:ribosomal protein S18 acetylase RimI-like enzyme